MRMILAGCRRHFIRNTILFATGVLAILYYLLHKYPKLQEHESTHPEVFAPSKFTLEQNGDYWIYNNFKRGKKKRLINNKTITLTTHGTRWDLKHMEWLLERWNAPISLAMFVPPHEFINTLHQIYYLKHCTKYAKKWTKWVSMHLVFTDEFMLQTLKRLKYINQHTFDCNLLENPYEKINYFKYPVNLLRNIARLNARTYYVLSLDPGVLPTKRFPEMFLRFAHSYHPVKPHKSVYCLPIIPQLDFNTKLPNTKSELLTQMQYYFNGNIKFEHLEEIHVNKLRRWLTSSIADGVINVFEVNRTPHNCTAYVSVNTYDPFYDQRHQDSIFAAKSAKLKVLIGLGFDFILLDGSFLVTRNGTWPTTLVDTLSDKKLDDIIEVIKLNNLALTYSYLE